MELGGTNGAVAAWNHSRPPTNAACGGTGIGWLTNPAAFAASTTATSGAPSHSVHEPTGSVVDCSEPASVQ